MVKYQLEAYASSDATYDAVAKIVNFMQRAWVNAVCHFKVFWERAYPCGRATKNSGLDVALLRPYILVFVALYILI